MRSRSVLDPPQLFVSTLLRVNGLRLDTSLALARAVAGAARLGGRGGTSLPGRVLLRIDSGGIARLGARLSEGSAVISATNGKTTSAAMAASILGAAGRSLVHNRAGSNMDGGIASALLDATRPGGTMAGALGLFEVDEFFLERMLAALQPRVVVLGNLFRDQLDRYGELETIADRWAAALQRSSAVGEDPVALVLNADDPLVADLGRERAPGPLYFGIEDDGVALDGLAHAADSKHCRRCGHPYRYAAVYLGHLGRYACPHCGQTRPQPAVHAREIVLEGVRGARFTLTTPAGSAAVRLPLPGLYNIYNALAAAALAHQLGVELGHTRAGLERVTPAFGRAETMTVGSRRLQILLVKNPAGANEVLRTLVLEPGEHDLLAILNDKAADGRDVSWIWDADFESLAPRARSVWCSGTRAAELALRLKYAGVPVERLHTEPELARALQAALSERSSGPLYAIPTYTAMLALRELLVADGHARSSWH
jgi:UDP-N-acetylmuramyl tripeptide synthase